MRLSLCLPTFSRAAFLAVVFTLLYGSTPAAAVTLTVCASGCTYADLQHAIDAAQPGDTIRLRAGETFVGHFRLPVKYNPGGQFIVIRSDAPDHLLPPAGTRLVPHGYRGGNTDRSALARLVGRGGAWRTTPVVETDPGAHHYRLQFLEIDGLAQAGWETLVQLGVSSGAQSTMESVPYAIVLDRLFIHGHPTKGQKRCVALDGRDFDLLNSYITNCASIDFDAQAIAGFNGPGPFRIINNYVEGTGENLMFGGADPKIHGLVPSDIEIRRNHFFKPLDWRDPLLRSPSRPSVTAVGGGGSLSAGAHYFTVVATLDSASEPAFSAPSAERAVSLDSHGSTVTLTWEGVPGAERYRIYRGTSSGAQDRYIETAGAGTSFTYSGTDETWRSPQSWGTKWNVKNLLELKNAQRVLIDGNVFEHLWPASQQGYPILFTPRNEEGGAPWSTVRDVTFSNNILRHASAGINILGEDDVRGSLRTGRITIRNNLVYDLSNGWGGSGHFLLITRSPFDIVVDHNTVFHHGMVVVSDDSVSSGFRFTNNLAPHNTYGIFGSGAGMGTSALTAYFPDYVVRRNALGGGPASLYPPDNFFPDMATFNSQFVNVGGHDYRLVEGSSFRGAGTDGRDVGVDFNELSAAVQGVVSGGDGWIGGDGSGGGGAPAPEPAPAPGGGGGEKAYNGTPAQLPGTIEAENFDDEGNGVGYYDTTSGNSGGQFRGGDVDIETTSDSGGGYNVGWMAPGEWLKYTVNVASAGTYTIEVRVAATSGGGTFHIEVNGIDKTGPLTIPSTGGWQSWTTVRKTNVDLAAGGQVWALIVDSAGPGNVVGNVNSIQVLPAAGGGGSGTGPYGGTPVVLPGTIQAEDFDNGGQHVAFFDDTPGNYGGEFRSGDVDIEVAADEGGGYSLGWLAAGEWLHYTVNVAAAGTYDLDLRVASAGTGGRFHIEVNGVDRTGPISIPDTGGWQAWTTVRHAGVYLPAGVQVWRLVMDANGPATRGVGNINFVRVLNPGGGTVPVPAPPPAGGGSGDIVLYSSDVETVRGNWVRTGSASTAGGLKMGSPDWGWASVSEPLAAPSDYFEAHFVPEANRPYRVWLRLRASGDSKYNDSVWVQFSGALSTTGSPRWQTGTGSGLMVNLERCGDCGVSGWGWQNRAWWLDDDAIVQFSTASAQTLRIQTREDGVEIDQIVLSPATYFFSPHGGPVNDSTIVPKQ